MDSDIDWLYLQLSKIEQGEESFWDDIPFKVGDFIQDWQKDKTRDWSKSLIELIKRADSLLLEMDQANSYQFKALESFKKDNPETEIHSITSPEFPRLGENILDEVIIQNELEELKLLRRNQSSTLIPALKSLKKTLQQCLAKYEKDKDSEIFKPTFLQDKKIPILGNERQISAFFYLLIEGNFIFSKGPFEDLKVDRTSFKKYQLKKQTLAKLISEYFFSLGPGTEIGKDGPKLEAKALNPDHISSKLNDQAVKSMGQIDQKRFRKGFEKILSLLD